VAKNNAEADRLVVAARRGCVGAHGLFEQSLHGSVSDRGGRSGRPRSLWRSSPSAPELARVRGVEKPLLAWTLTVCHHSGENIPWGTCCLWYIIEVGYYCTVVNFRAFYW